MQNNNLHGFVFNLKRYSINDGPGIRQTVFLKGCPLNCIWCHNPESRDIKPQTTLKTCMLEGKAFKQKETIGTKMSVEELMTKIKKDTVFYDESDGGVTFSGGEPLMQYQFLKQVLGRCNEEGIHTAVDTSGFADKKVFESIAQKTDLFLYDLKLMNNDAHIKFTGVSNKLILQNLLYLNEHKNKVIIRFPVIPKITDNEENINLIVEFLSGLKNIRKISLLPYHNIANSKYKRLKLKNQYCEVASMQKDGLLKFKPIFESIGFNVTIGA